MMDYPRVIVVHLARHRERRRRLSAQLKKHGFSDVTWLKAVDGKNLDPTPPWQVDSLPSVHAWRGWVDPYARRAMTLGEVGCSLSHVMAWQNIVKSGSPTLVLEDDAMPVEPLIADLPMLLHDLSYLEFDLCYLAQRNHPGPKPLAGRHIHLVDYHPLWTLSYLLSPAGARKLLAAPWQQHLTPADDMLIAGFGLNNDAEVNRAYAQTGGTVVSSNQRFFTPADSSVASETEKSLPILETDLPLSAFTVATEQTPELERLLDSGRRYGLDITPLGLGQVWRGGDVAKGPGGGQKINLLRPALRDLPPAQPVLFIDGYDTIVSRHARDILASWHKISEGAPLFAAEVFCWPDAGRADDYPQTEDSRYRFLNSGAFIGKAGDLLRILSKKISDHEDDQRYYTERFLSARHGMMLDHKCQLFQCLNGALDDVEADAGRGMLYNRTMESWPAVVHANGPTKSWLDNEGYAVGGRWRRYYGDMVTAN